MRVDALITPGRASRWPACGGSPGCRGLQSFPLSSKDYVAIPDVGHLDECTTDRYSTEIIADQMQMLGGRDDGQAGEAKAAAVAGGGRAKGRSGQVPAASPAAGSAALEESDIPF